MSKLEVFPFINGEWGFRLKASNGKIVAQGEGYKRRSGAMAGARAVQRAAARARLVVLPR
jgi:uncharacterized protein YegP (UPF0339 family)